MPIYMKDGRSVLFVHVPKTGGSSVEQHFVASGWRQHMRDAKLGRHTVNWLRRSSPQHLHAALLAEMLRVDRFDLVFMLVRDPLARFRSEVAMRHPGATAPTFEEVDEWTRTHLDLCSEDPYVFDNHLRPQHQFRLPGTEVYRLEDGLDATVADLNTRFGLDLKSSVGHKMSRERESGFASRDVPMSRRTTRRVRRFYRADYRSFGY